jgi:hypothetical protein
MFFCVSYKNDTIFGGDTQRNMQAKPAIKEASINWLVSGQTAKVLFYGENLAPKEITLKGPAGMSAKLLGVKPTEEKEKAKGVQTAEVEITIPENCPPESFDLTFVHEKLEGKDNNALVKICVVEKAAVEVPVKKPCQRFGDAMPMPEMQNGTSVAISGVLEGDNPCIVLLPTKRGETWEFTLTSSRAGAEIEEVLRIRDSKRRPVMLATGRKPIDKKLLFRAPQDGQYYVEWMDTVGRGGPKTYFRLLIKRK